MPANGLEPFLLCDLLHPDIAFSDPVRGVSGRAYLYV
jgi:hypothetical protein